MGNLLQPLTIVAALLGGALVIVALRDIFHTLFHPSGAGSISRMVTRLVWQVFRSSAVRRRGWLVLAGPSAVVVVLAAWAALLATG